MTQQDIIIIYLLLLTAVLLLRELHRQRRERNSDIIKDSEKADRIIHTLDLQEDVITSMNKRVNLLGQAMSEIIKGLEKEHEKRKNNE